jgi:hypothetical protein
MAQRSVVIERWTGQRGLMSVHAESEVLDGRGLTCEQEPDIIVLFRKVGVYIALIVAITGKHSI